MDMAKPQNDLPFICRVLAIFNGFDGPGTDGLWWRTDDEHAPVTFFASCNDLFMWGCADAEDNVRRLSVGGAN